MEFECDRCHQKLGVPDKWAGRRVRCRGCNRVLVVPEPEEAPLGSSINLGALAAGTEEPSEPLVTEFAPIPVAHRTGPADKTDRALKRKCPHCGKLIKVMDPYSEVLCSGCWRPVPPTDSIEPEKNDSERAQRAFERTLAFYDGIVGVFGYPMGAIGAILLSMLVAGGAILLPVGLILMFVMGVALNPIAPGANLSWVPTLLAVMFLIEGVYFAGMGYSLLLDSTRLTIAGNDKPPELSWNPATVGSGLIGYAVLVLVYGSVYVGVNYVVSGGKTVLPTSLDEVRQLRSPVTIAALALLTFTVPMAVIGLASMPGIQGLSPGRIIRSIVGCFVHYLFLFVVVCIMLGVYFGLTAGVVAWAGDAVLKVLRQGVSKGFDTLLLGLLAWTILVGTGLYCAYMMGRLHGLFARTFRNRLAFDI